MGERESGSSLGYREIVLLAIPVILANSTTPLLGLVDTAVMGRTGSETDLGAIALSALLFNFLYWGFGFLRMSTSGFVAQASGARDATEEAAIVLRGLSLAGVIAAVLLVLQWPICALSLRLFGASAAVEEATRGYFFVRIWGAPATLGTYVLMGVLVGRGQTRVLLWLQLLLNGANIVLDVLFAAVLGWGVRGIALGTALSSWLTVGVGLWVILRSLQVKTPIGRAAWVAALRHREKMRQMLVANGDILIRTFFLLLGFAVFTDQGARFGDKILAANHILLQFVTFSAFFLDGFAHVTESMVGKAVGARRRGLFLQAVWRSSLLAGVTAALLGLGCWLGGGLLVRQLTTLVEVQQVALVFLPYAVVYVMLSFAAFQLDGIFIGITQTRILRNASILSTTAFLLACWGLVAWGGNHGLWLAFWVFVVVRAIALGRSLPGAYERAVAGLSPRDRREE